MRRPLLVVMAKEPRVGRVKTRLARGIGPVAAAWWYRHALRRTCAALSDPRWRLVLAVGPDRALTSRALPRGVARVPQGGGDLGARMARLLDPGGPVAVVGSDVPGVTARHIARAFAALGSREAVLGPATDGGYWLIGWAGRRRFPARALEGLRWSTEHALADTLAGFGGLPVALADRLADVDEAGDLR